MYPCRYAYYHICTHSQLLHPRDFSTSKHYSNILNVVLMSSYMYVYSMYIVYVTKCLTKHSPIFGSGRQQSVHQLVAPQENRTAGTYPACSGPNSSEKCPVALFSHDGPNYWHHTDPFLVEHDSRLNYIQRRRECGRNGPGNGPADGSLE